MEVQLYETGWWLSHPSEKYEFVSWDDEIPNIWKNKKKMFQTTNQETSGYRMIYVGCGSTLWKNMDCGSNWSLFKSYSNDG